jgi:hypothetical protein
VCGCNRSAAFTVEAASCSSGTPVMSVSPAIISLRKPLMPQKTMGVEGKSSCR